jgi:lysine 2,3-aminomutase
MKDIINVHDEFGVPEEEPPSSACCLLEAPASAPEELHNAVRKRANGHWRDWRWQMRHRIRSFAELRQQVPGCDTASICEEAGDIFLMAITPYYASLIREAQDSDPIFRMSVPTVGELHDPPHLYDDPLAEEHSMPVPGLVHRYGDRALLLATTTCAAYCRHCTRKRVAGWRETAITSTALGRAVNYLRQHPEIKDVIISGGDPLTLSTEVLERVLRAVRSVPSVDIIRIGTRTPVTLPFRITEELVDMLRKYHPVWINTHFNHPREITPEAREACERLADAGIPLGNQTVLLRGVNDNPETIEQLCRGLLKIRVRPYYLFQCDLVRGVEHFRTPLAKGIEIMEYLRGRMSGLGIPSFVVDAPNGGGKIPLLPNYIVSTSPTHTVLRNYKGTMVSYPEPAMDSPQGGSGRAAAAPTVWDVATGRAPRIPAEPPRQRHQSNDSSDHPTLASCAAFTG